MSFFTTFILYFFTTFLNYFMSFFIFYLTNPCRFILFLPGEIMDPFLKRLIGETFAAIIGLIILLLIFVLLSLFAHHG